MRVAVIGAGLSGLACAITLEKHGIPFDIFERRPSAGETFHHVSAILQVMNRPIADPLIYLQEQLGLNIEALNPIETIVMKTAHKESAVRGKDLGYFFCRGHEKISIEQQLLQQLKTPVQFNVHANWRQLAKDYDRVVVCDGGSRTTRELGCWSERFRAWVKGASVVGDFDPNMLKMWLNSNYCKSGYAYLTPYDRNRAFIGLIVPNCDQQELDYYWNLFCKLENIRLDISETFEVYHSAGFVHPHHVDNILLAGTAGGVQDPFLGFGQFNSLSAGVFAARSIATGESYENLIEALVENVNALYFFRCQLDRMTNNQFDLLVKTIGLPGLNQLMYNTNLNVIRVGGIAIKTYVQLKKRLSQFKS